MARKMEWIAREISGIVETSERQVVVVDAVSGAAVRLPRVEVEFGPRKVFVSGWAWATIYRPTIEKIAAGKPLPQNEMVMR